ncbi:DNA polymerase I [Panacagrimonas perspica]|uniref:DNA polymerase I n=1 Tax=Panacagrimonas perspica TaxID=381431 RepID=A0A4S3K789_9GAMM|nr:DNA polymerase I [Panacagrimonas perspica]TDU26723.1 DNA polymerase I [Panacagrimonas perspica]THD04065.1 DNA polymerase I [Panacagrimonas perspica]
MHPLILVDGSNWLFRAFHALPPLTAPDGTPTGAVFGMNNMLRRLIKDYQPKSLAMVFDPPGRTFREDIYPEYKATRGATPEDLVLQFPLVVELCEALGMRVLQVAGVEADDVIGTLAVRAAAAGQDVLIVTGDKDMAQLVTSQVHLLDTMKNRRMDPAGVVEKFGVLPERIVDFLALMGDTSDNIPGVPGVGEKTAAKLITEHGSLDGVLAAAPTIKGKLGENIRANLDRIPLAKDLATIRTALELGLTPEDLVPREPDEVQLEAFYARLGMLRRAADPGTTSNAGGPAATTAAPPSPAPDAPRAAATAAELVVDEAALEAMAQALERADLICLDTETDALDANQAGLVGFAFAIEEGKGWYVPVAHNYLGAPEQLSLEVVRARLKAVLEDDAKPKVGQHIKYDLNVLARHGIVVRGVAYDTMLESYVLDAAGNRHDMDTLSEKYLGHKTIKFEDVAGKGKNQITFNQVALDKAADYSAEDADITLRLHRALHPRLVEIPELQRVFETIEMPLVPVLARMEQTGVRVDVPLLNRISVELAARMDQIRAEAFEVAGGEFNLGSPKQLQEILFTRLGLRVVSKTPKGDPSTAEDVLEVLAEEHPLPRKILDWRGMQKLRSTYAEQLPNAVNPLTRRIHTSYHQAVAATGRLSSQDPNLQNIPVRTAEGRRIRQAFIPEDGQSLLSIDYSQIELRLMAHFSADERLVAAFRSGLDIHQATAAEVWGVALDQVTGEQRRAAKAVNFGLIYGISAFGLARNLGIARGEAQDTIDRFFGRYPGVKRFMDGTRHAAHERGYVETLFGRRLYLPNIQSKNQAMRQYAERTAINAPLQGTAADLIKLAMIDVQRWLEGHAPDVRMIMQVHDELVFEGPSDRIAALASEIAGRMVSIHTLSVPLVADYGIGTNWDEAHTATGHAIS